MRRFDKLKPGMFLYNKQKNITSWLVVRQMSSDTVMVDNYCRNPSGRFYKDYDCEINKYEWNDQIYKAHELATLEQAQELIVMIFARA